MRIRLNMMSWAVLGLVASGCQAPSDTDSTTAAAQSAQTTCEERTYRLDGSDDPFAPLPQNGRTVQTVRDGLRLEETITTELGSSEPRRYGYTFAYENRRLVETLENTGGFDRYTYDAVGRELTHESGLHFRIDDFNSEARPDAIFTRRLNEYDNAGRMVGSLSGDATGWTQRCTQTYEGAGMKHEECYKTNADGEAQPEQRTWLRTVDYDGDKPVHVQIFVSGSTNATEIGIAYDHAGRRSRIEIENGDPTEHRVVTFAYEGPVTTAMVEYPDAAADDAQLSLVIRGTFGQGKQPTAIEYIRHGTYPMVMRTQRDTCFQPRDDYSSWAEITEQQLIP